jgi:tetratricopeptide (TPR) repeat protein
MKKIIKKIFFSFISLLGVWIVAVLGTAYYAVYQEHKTAEEGRKNIKGTKIKEEIISKIQEVGAIIKNGSKYEDEGKYDLAIEQYKKAMELGENDDKALCRVLLADVYEKSGQYELAIQEIDWIIAQNPREEVKDEYIARKQKLEKLITERSM